MPASLLWLRMRYRARLGALASDVRTDDARGETVLIAVVLLAEDLAAGLIVELRDDRRQCSGVGNALNPERNQLLSGRAADRSILHLRCVDGSGAARDQLITAESGIPLGPLVPLRPLRSLSTGRELPGFEVRRQQLAVSDLGASERLLS